MPSDLRDPLEGAIRRFAGVTGLLGRQADGIGYQGRVALVSCVMPTHKANKLRACMAKVFREVFTERSDLPVVMASNRLNCGLPDGYVDAAQILRERGYLEVQVWRLAGEFGKDLKVLAQDKLIQTVADSSHGPCEKEVNLYHRVDDSRLIESALSSFRKRELHERVLANHPDPVAARQKRRLDEQGRGRKKARQTVEERSRAIKKSEQ